MNDESVSMFYGCTICQSLAFDHVCVITPERPGSCGRCSWKKAQDFYRVNPTGGHQPIDKEKIQNLKRGGWSGVNKFVNDRSHKKVNRVFVYSISKYPMTSCILSECVAAVIPEANGVIIVDRRYQSDTPIGMTTKELFDVIKSGKQVPGFMGISRSYILSRKFILADGGLTRVVWMPKVLKNFLGKKLKVRACEIGCPDFPLQIADETVATDAAGVIRHLARVGHPALSMPRMI